ncbi:chaperonin 10-like protein [Lophiotrema nucula]|uniref:Chaperonin 10-like protein n=1 Tax=Lophiotrema nucula TaxID=690887 RepID=A0A6A5ZL75_9PLEO|nr:chaperonin 10-like protein [Lophiotrema nucula]
MVSQMLAQVQRNKGDTPTLSKEKIDRSTPASNQVLVKISHVAQNPTDVQTFDGNAFGDGTVLGCDFVGTVEELGSEVTRLKKGDVVAGLIWGGEIKGLGAYSEYTVADERISFKVPKSISSAEASTIPLAAATAWLALFSKDCLGIERKNTKGTSLTSVLVWGGSSSVGLYTIQLANLMGLQVITTCSPRNFELVESQGAHHVFDYSDKDIVAKINEVEPNLKYVFDTIGNETSSGLASQVITKEGGHLCTVRPGKANTSECTKQTKITDVLVWTAFLKDHSYGDFHWPANKDDHELASELFENLPEWIEAGKVKPNKVGLKKGLDALEEGFQEYRDGKINAYKIVYEL